MKTSTRRISHIHRPVHHPTPSALAVPIAVKYAMITAGSLILFMVALGVFLYRTTVEELDREVNDKGFKLATMAASSVDPDAKIEAIEAQLVKFVGDQASTGILDVVLYNADQTEFIAKGRQGADLERAVHETEDKNAAAHGIRVFSGTMDDAPVRSFRKPIIVGGEAKAIIEVSFSLQSVQDNLAAAQNATILIVLVSVAIGLVVAVLVGNWLTRPVRILKQDMMVVASGDLQHQSKVHTGDELEALANTFNRMTQHLAHAQEQEATRKALERELSIAANIQSALLPDRIPKIDGFDLYPHYESAKEVGGDYYDFIPLNSDRYAIVVADVSGKGIPGSLVMTMTRSLVRMAARQTDSVGKILAMVNSSLSSDMTRGMFVTLVLADINVSTGRARIARAGHNPALLYRKAENKLLQVQPEGIALGMDKGDLFASTLKVQEFPMESGDLLVLYTDGIIEAMDPKGNEYSSERFADVITANSARSSRGVVQKVIEDVEGHTKGGEPSDDITLIVLKRS